SGAKSALDPNSEVSTKPYVDDDLPTLDLTVPAVRTVDPERTFWDKVVILHGLRRWFDKRGEPRGGGQRVSRHYYDLHKLLPTPTGIKDPELGADCVAHPGCSSTGPTSISRVLRLARSRSRHTTR